MSRGTFGALDLVVVRNYIEEYIVLHDGVVIKKQELKMITDTGIHIPQQEDGNRFDFDTPYEVIKVGPEVKNVKVGDFVMLPHNIQGLYPVTLKSKGDTKPMQCFQVFENWILGIFPKDPNDSRVIEGAIPVKPKSNPADVAG